jgi:hypothetical protein
MSAFDAMAFGRTHPDGQILKIVGGGGVRSGPAHLSDGSIVRSVDEDRTPLLGQL